MAALKFITVFLVLSIGALAQNVSPKLPETPQPKTFTRSSSIEMSLAAAAISADGFTSYQIYDELNPIARPLVRTKTGTTAYFAGSFAALVAGNRVLRNHPRWRHALNWSVIGTETFWAANNFRLRRRM